LYTEASPKLPLKVPEHSIAKRSNFKATLFNDKKQKKVNSIVSTVNNSFQEIFPQKQQSFIVEEKVA
jgi:hypothetical protein